jgi:hypothetical protein
MRIIYGDCFIFLMYDDINIDRLCPLMRFALHFLRRLKYPPQNISGAPRSHKNAKSKKEERQRILLLSRESLNAQTVSHFLHVRCVASVERISQRKRRGGVSKEEASSFNPLQLSLFFGH